GDQVNTRVRHEDEVGGQVVDPYVNERAEQHASEDGSDNAAYERDEDSFGEQLAGDHPTGGTDGEADGQLARAVGSARGEDAGGIGAGSEQDQKSDEHDGQERLFDWVIALACGAGTTHSQGKAVIFLILFGHLA